LEFYKIKNETFDIKILYTDSSLQENK